MVPLLPPTFLPSKEFSAEEENAAVLDTASGGPSWAVRDSGSHDLTCTSTVGRTMHEDYFKGSVALEFQL